MFLSKRKNVLDPKVALGMCGGSIGLLLDMTGGSFAGSLGRTGLRGPTEVFSIVMMAARAWLGDWVVKIQASRLQSRV